MTTRATVSRMISGLRRDRPLQIITTSGAVVFSNVTTSGLGFVYWWVAAVLFAQASVGLASAGVSAMMLLGALSGLGLGTLLVTEMPRHPGRELGLIATALVITATVGGALGLVFALIATLLGPELAPLAESPLSVAGFAFGTSVTAAVLVMDVALVGLMRGDLQLMRNATFALLKLGLLISVGLVVGRGTGNMIVATWVVGSALSLALLGVYLVRTGLAGPVVPLQPAILRRLRGPALRHYALNVSLQSPDWIVPILVTALLASGTGAAFFIAWMIVGVAFAVPGALAQTLYSVGARNGDALRPSLLLTLRLSFLAGAGIVLALFLLGPFALGLLDRGYQAAAPALVILSLGIFPMVIKVHYVTLGRLSGRITQTTVVCLAAGMIEIGLAAVGAVVAGLTGVAVGILLGLVIQATIMVPRVRHALRGDGESNGGLR